MITLLGFDISYEGLLLGAVIGMTYGILAVGLVLIYRTNKVINFAHGEIGAFGAAMLGVMVVRWHFPYWLAFVAAILFGALAGAIVEMTVVRRLRNAPKLMTVVATLGVGVFIVALSLALVAKEILAGATYPEPAGLPEFDIGFLRITRAYFGMMILSPIVVAALTIFLRRSRMGLAIRAAASDAEGARLVAVPAGRMSAMAWAIAGAVSAFTALLVLPTQGLFTPETFGPGLLLRALAAAVIGRMVNMPVAFLSGIALGMIEVLISLNSTTAGLTEMVMFVVIVVALLLQTRRGAREEEKGSWAAVQPWRPLPESYTKVWSIRNLGRVLGFVAVAGAVLLPVFFTNRISIIFVGVIAFGLIGLSVGVITGLSGQLSLGQFALGGVGATVSFLVSKATGNFLLSFALAALVTAAVSLIIGIPALRIRGLMLAVTTLSFALAGHAWLFQQPWMLGGGKNPGRPIIGNLALETGKGYYLFSLVFLLLGLWVYRNVRSSGFGRSLVALRDNEDGARAFTIPATLRKLQAFGVAGAIAGVGGAVYGHSLANISFEIFDPLASIDVVAMSVIGGLGIAIGPLLGALYILGVPEFLPLDNAGLAATAFGWLLLILYFPGGLAQLLQPLRDRVVDALARRDGIDPVKERSPDDEAEDTDTMVVTLQDSAPKPVEEGEGPSDRVLLQVTDLSKHYGGVTAVDEVTVSVRQGETLGLIGPNGAGKTTLFELVSGFVAPDSGAIAFNDQDISKLTPQKRGQLGLIRSFQDAALFETMTVFETALVALERLAPSRLGAGLLGLKADEREKQEAAAALIELMGLQRFRHKMIRELSTGTRRITELMCMIALDPKLLLLDEPSSGVAQRETEALAGLLERLKKRLGTTLVIIEHDMPLVMGISDRIIAMESGRIIADGPPAEVRSDSRVIESYLGGDTITIERSDVAVGAT